MVDEPSTSRMSNTKAEVTASLRSCAMVRRTCIRRCKKREGRHTAWAECDDPAVKDGFAVIKHSTECVDDLGERSDDDVSVSRPQRRSLGICCGYVSLAIPFRFEGPALPCRGLPERGEHRRHWLSGGGAHTVHCALVCTGFGRFSEVETIVK